MHQNRVVAPDHKTKRTPGSPGGNLGESADSVGAAGQRTTGLPVGIYQDQKQRKIIRRKALGRALGAGFVLLAALLGVLYLVQPQAELLIRDAETSAPLSGATVTLGDTRVTTDQAGLARIRSFQTGDTSVTVSRDSYLDATTALKLGYGQRVSQSIELDLASTAEPLTFTIIDVFSRQPITGATVLPSSGSEATANDTGEVTLDVISDTQLTVRSNGYRDQIVPASAVSGEVSLTPVGEVIFVSNRDQGKRGLYRATFDGAQVEPLVRRIGTSEDFDPSPSPDRSVIVFRSTRDGLKDEYGSQAALVYGIRSDGSGLVKLSDDRVNGQVTWSQDSRSLYWIGEVNDRYHIRRYDIRSGKTTTLAESANGFYSFTLSDDGALAAYEESKVGVWVVTTATGAKVRAADATHDVYEFNRDRNLELARYDDGRRIDLVYFADSGVILEEQRTEQEQRSGVQSPNHQLMAYVDERDGQTDLFVADPEGANERRLTTLGTVVGYGYPITWSQNGRYLTFGVERTGESAIYIVSLDGGEPVKITDATFEYGYY